MAVQTPSRNLQQATPNEAKNILTKLQPRVSGNHAFVYNHVIKIRHLPRVCNPMLQGFIPLRLRGREDVLRQHRIVVLNKPKDLLLIRKFVSRTKGSE